MSMFNDVRLVGNLVKDPIMNGSTEKEWCVLRIACNSGKKENADTLYIDIKAFGNAYSDVEYFDLKKGDRVSVGGCLKNNSYETKDGAKVNEYAIYADFIMKVSKKSSSSPVPEEEPKEVKKEPFPF